MLGLAFHFLWGFLHLCENSSVRSFFLWGLGFSGELGCRSGLDESVFLQTGEGDIRLIGVILHGESAVLYLPGGENHQRTAFQILGRSFAGLGLFFRAIAEDAFFGGNQQFWLSKPGI